MNHILASIPTTLKINLISPDLENNGKINKINTKEGGNVMIRLNWYCETGCNNSEIGSYALICIDLHPKAKQWVHLYIPKIAIEKSSFINNNVKKLNSNESIIGMNSFNERGYGGPQPPKGTGEHKYVFYLFALDKNVNVSRSEENESKNIDQFINMVGKTHILSYATLSGFYEYTDE